MNQFSLPRRVASVKIGFHTGISALVLFFGVWGQPALAQPPEEAAKEVEAALHLTPNPENGKRIYQICAVCHTPEGWGTESGYYPQIAGQLPDVTIKQLADIRARNRDNPTMLPFASPRLLGGVQEIADVAAYIAKLPMDPHNAVGPGVDLDYGKKLFEENCADCHGNQGEGNAKKHSPRIQGQHFNYLRRQFDWIRSGRRRNADKEMVAQIRRFTPRDEMAVLDYVSRLRPPAEMVAQPGWQNPDFPKFARGAFPPAALAGQPPLPPGWYAVDKGTASYTYKLYNQTKDDLDFYNPQVQQMLILGKHTFIGGLDYFRGKTDYRYSNQLIRYFRLFTYGLDTQLVNGNTGQVYDLTMHFLILVIGSTPFLLAAKAADVPLMRTLLDVGADPSITTERGTTALMVAAGVGIWARAALPATAEAQPAGETSTPEAAAAPPASQPDDGSFVPPDD